MFRKNLLPLGFTLLCVVTLSISAQAATLLVGKSAASCPNSQYSTIAGALSAAGPGDEIDVCPGLYAEQLVITKPLTLRGVAANNVGRVLIQPATLAATAGVPEESVITVMNTAGVTIQNLSIDASNNGLTGCSIGLSGIHFLNSSGAVENNAIFGAVLSNPKSCPMLFPGTGFGVHVEMESSWLLCHLVPCQVSIEHNSIHDFGRDGILVVGQGANVKISDNNITGVGPSTGVFQFGIFLANGATGQITGNDISEAGCGPLSPSDCFNLRSEGVVLRSVGDGTIIDGNMITTAQVGLFLNGANAAQVTNNVIKDISGGRGIQVQSITNSLIAGNKISGVGPISSDALTCGIFEPSVKEQGVPPGTIANAGNTLRNNVVTDAYCGIASVTADKLDSNSYFNTLYDTLNTDQLANSSYPPASEPQ